MSPASREGLEGSVRTAAIVGIAGTSLRADERDLFARMKPAGFILFARNCSDPDQVTSLVRELCLSVDDAEAPVLIDQEGGRVARLKPPHWQGLPPLRRIGELAPSNVEAASEAAWLHARLIASDLEPLGITINCSPVLDLGVAGQTEAIGDRAFSDDPDLVATLGRATIEGFVAGGIIPVIKHLPGHGRATVDSHATLPFVAADVRELADSDWLPFRANAGAPMGITAHILFSELDRECCATHSKTIIQDVIRGRIGFEGALLSDDLSMEALGGSLGERASLARQAGCDIALHCNGDLDEMKAVLDATGPLEGESLTRFERALSTRRQPDPFDAKAARERLDALIGPGTTAAEALR